MRKLFLLFFLFLSAPKLNAAIFFVTSNADAGAGTLRQAMISANANGTVLQDQILFTLPGNTISALTIALQSELPILTSNIIIDATGQALFDPTVKVTITRAAATYFHGFRLDNANHIEIYGLTFSNFKSDPSGPVSDRKGAIYLYNSSFVTIGAPTKSNYFVNNDAGILSPTITPKFDNSNLKISANFFGLAADGLTSQPNENGIDISYIKDGVIGGDTPAEGNVITSNLKNGITLNLANGTIKIANNIIGLDQTLANNFPVPASNGIFITADTGTPQIVDNIICGQNKGIMLANAKNGFVIAGNKIGTSLTDNDTFGNKIGIHIYSCGAGTIGGTISTAENRIAHNETAVLIDNSYPISILKNSFYCNIFAVTFVNMPSGYIVASKISTITATSVSGKYLPNATIDLFYADECGDECQGKTWFKTITADGNGDWSYNGPINRRLTSMGTNTAGATSPFSKPELNDFEHYATPSLCGLKTGGIFKMHATDANVFEWYNKDNGLRVGFKLDLDEGVPAGRYYLIASQGGKCAVVSTVIEVRSVPVVIDDKGINRIPETCGASNGGITGITVANNLKRIWYVQDDDREVTRNDNLVNVPAGRYYFIVGTGDCAKRSETYQVDKKEASYVVRGFKISKVACGLPTGRIEVSGEQVGSVFTFKWFDADNNVVGNSETVENLPIGAYRLVAYSENLCEVDVGTFEITEDPLPTIDYSAIQKYRGCDGKFVSTSGIAINGSSGPYKYLWTDENGNAVSNQLNLISVPPGTYLLQVTDNNGCIVDGQFLDLTTLTNTTMSVPNSITPNGDGVNDVWQINGAQNYRTADFSIYGRDGNRVFYSRGYTTSFDGTYNGKLLPIGVYYYVIDLKADCPRLTGSLTILR